MIEKNIPLPSRNYRIAFPIPFSEMEIGDSFFIPLTNGQTKHKLQTTISVRINYFCNYKAPGWRFTTHQQENGVRLWRVA